MNKHIAVIGLGPHARRIYLPLLNKHSKEFSLTIPVIIDLSDQEAVIEKYLHDSKFTIPINKTLYLDNYARTQKQIDPKAERELSKLKAEGKLDAVIISTEPKSHKMYAEWALKNDVDILMDKPVTSPIDCANDVKRAARIYDDYTYLKKLLLLSKSNFVVECQRRYHHGYTYIEEYLKKFVAEYRIPITYLDIYHADGMWNMPDEFTFRENHPYKYGYGKLMHSGYHFVDLLVSMAAINNLLPDKKPNNVTMFVNNFRPYDFFHTINSDDYNKLFGTRKFDDVVKNNTHNLKKYGEIDVYAMVQFKRDDKVVTTATMNLMQDSFSRRAWTELPEDTYKGNGRVRHERLNVQVSHLLNTQVHSYQCYEVKKKDVETTGAGTEDHFDINFYRNSELVGGQTLEKLSLGEKMKEENVYDSSYIGHNEKAREDCFLDFIKGVRSASDYYSHELTNLFLSKLYEAIAIGRAGGVPLVNFQI